MLSILSSTFVGAHEFRKNLTRLLDELKKDKGELVITQQGKPVAILSDMETYLEMKQAMKEFSDPNFITELIEAKKEIKEGKGIPASKVFAQKGV